MTPPASVRAQIRCDSSNSDLANSGPDGRVASDRFNAKIDAEAWLTDRRRESTDNVRIGDGAIREYAEIAEVRTHPRPLSQTAGQPHPGHY